MIVAVVPVRVVQVAGDKVIDVIAVRYGRVTTAARVHVVGRMTAARVLGSARARVRRINDDRALVDVIVVDLVKMAVVQEVDVVAVPD